EEGGENGKTDHSTIRPCVARVELGVGKASAERKCVFSANPTGVDGRHPAVLENPGERALRSCRRPDILPGVENKVRIRRRLVSQIIDNRDARKNRRTECVDAYRLSREGLGNRAEYFLADEAEDFGDAEVRREGLRVGNACDLAAGVQVLVDPFDGGKPERRGGGIVLVVILQRQGVFGGGEVVQVRDSLIRNKIGRLSEKHIFRKVERGCEIGIRRRNHVLAVYLGIQQGE